MTTDLTPSSRTLARLRQLPYGVARTEATETVVRRIDANGPVEILAEALLDLVEAYTFSGEGAASFSAFARALRLWDTQPELFDETDRRNLFWEFKWVAGDLPDFPEITLPQAEALLADMRRRFEIAGHGMSSVAMSDFRWAWHAGLPTAEATRLAWISTARDDFDDCHACTIGQQTDYFTDLGRFAEAVEIGITQSTTCNLEPSRTFFALALALLEVGRLDDAADYYQRARASFDPSSSDFAPARGQGFELLARGGRIEQALTVLREDDHELLSAASSPLFRLRFLIGVLAGLSANLDQADLPTGLSSDLATLGALHAWVEQEARAAGQLFDARSGTDYYARRVARAGAATRAEGFVPWSVGVSAATDAPTPPPAAEAAASAPHPSDASTAPAPVLAPVSALARADALLARRDHRGALDGYLIAATQALDEGRVVDAGHARCEAAHAAQLLGDDTTAHDYFGQGLAQLVAGGAEVTLQARVLVAWAPSAARVRDNAALVAQVRGLLDRDDLEPRVHADLLDTLARSLASLPEDRPGLDAAAAISAAHAAGEAYASLGAIVDAAHAFWTAGRVQRSIGDSEGAHWSLESAAEGFQIAEERNAQAEVVGELVELLREGGDDARAEELIASLLS